MSERFVKADMVMELAHLMTISVWGVSLSDIQDHFKVGYRSAMRLRNAVVRNFPQVVESELEDKTKRWAIPSDAALFPTGAAAHFPSGEDILRLKRIAEAAEESAQRGYCGASLAKLSEALREGV